MKFKILNVFLYSEDDYEPTITYFNDDMAIPYVKSNEQLTFEQILSACVFNNSSYVAQKVPSRCQENAIFILDTSKLKNSKDLLADDNGSYRNQSTNYNFVELLGDGEISSKALHRNKKVLEMRLDDNQYIVAKSWYINNSCKDFSRRVTEVHSSSGLSNIQILQYIFTGVEHEFAIQSHFFSKINVRPLLRLQNLQKTESRVWLQVAVLVQHLYMINFLRKPVVCLIFKVKAVFH